MSNVISSSDHINNNKFITDLNSLNGWSEIHDFYFNELSYIPHNNRYNYTIDFMRKISDYYRLGDISAVDLITINGSISTYLYSRLLWNYFIPNKTNHILIKTKDNKWIIFSGKECLSHYFQSQWSIVQYVCFPNIIDGVITEIFFFHNTIEQFPEIPIEEPFPTVEHINISNLEIIQCEYYGDIHPVESSFYSMKKINGRDDLVYYSLIKQ